MCNVKQKPKIEFVVFENAQYMVNEKMLSKLLSILYKTVNKKLV